MTVIREGSLEFVFGDSWTILKYDESGRYYSTCLSKQIPGTKAVDLLCLRDNSALVMMEVKDFSTGVPRHEKFDRLPQVIATKARDTLAGIVGGSCNAGDSEKAALAGCFRKLKQPPDVIYVFEDLATPARRPPERAKIGRSVLVKQLKTHLRWLTTKVIVVSLTDYDDAIDNLTIRRVS